MSSASLLVSIGQMILWICLIQTTQRSEAIGRQFAWGKMTFFILKLPIPPLPPSPTLNTDSLQQWALWENRQVVRHGRSICVPLPRLFCHHLPAALQLPLGMRLTGNCWATSVLSWIETSFKTVTFLPKSGQQVLSRSTWQGRRLFTIMGPDTLTQWVQTARDRGKGHSQLFPRLLQKQLLPTSPTLNIIST